MAIPRGLAIKIRAGCWVVVVMVPLMASAVPTLDSNDQVFVRHESAVICWNLRSEAANLEIIRDEKEATKVGGVVAVGRIGRAQRAVVEARKAVRDARAGIKALGVKPLPCDNGEVAYLVRCIESGGQGCDRYGDWALFHSDYIADK